MSLTAYQSACAAQASSAAQRDDLERRQRELTNERAEQEQLLTELNPSIHAATIIETQAKIGRIDSALTELERQRRAVETALDRPAQLAPMHKAAALREAAVHALEDCIRHDPELGRALAAVLILASDGRTPNVSPVLTAAVNKLLD
jgi:uncharacterized coiled-coil protein SlyX